MKSTMAPKGKMLVVQNQQSRSLDRILEEAYLSGELLLTGRKLKDFPKIASTGQCSLEDTVFADLSRNRFTELSDEITGFIFLETLLLNQNVLRSIPDTVRSLTSLSFLDLRNNQLTSLPREICSLPLKILLVSNNRLLQLPDELGRMDKLTELDASCNQIAHLPNRMMELRQLRALLLRNNQLVYIPREVTNLQLVTLDISGNRIGKLPTELRQMESLVNLELADNPLTFPPANLCVRGIVHVFKYLETVANKDDKRSGLTTGMSVDATLRRNASNPTHSLKLNGNNNNSINLLIENQQRKKHMSADGGGSLEHIDKQRWSSQEDTLSSPKWSPMHSKAPIVESPSNGNHSDLSPGEEKPPGGAKLSNVQTYKEYKEALKQQRNQDTTAVYRSKDHSSGSSSSGGSNQASPMSPLNENGKPGNGYDDIVIMNKPKVPPPAKSTTGPAIGKDSSKSELENSKNNNSTKNGTADGGYVKPTSPFGAHNKNGDGDSTDSMIIKSIMNGNLKNTGKDGDNNGKAGVATAKNNKRTVSWNRDIVTSEKNISFTMRREFDRHKEEAELIGKLRNILESRLKMTLPQDMAPALSDGVVLCHLANNVRPRSVASIHVPSPAVPKLTMARCRRNVDNFLDACRKIGVDDNLLCCSSDVLEGKTLVQVAITVAELAKMKGSASSSTNNSLASTPTTSPNTTLASSLSKSVVARSGNSGKGQVTTTATNGSSRTGNGATAISSSIQQSTTTVMSNNGRETTTRTVVSSRKVIAASNRTTS